MFNSYKFEEHTHNSYSPSKIDVTEKRAPTDESVRLLNEMQQKAMDNLVSCVQLGNNELRDITWWLYPDHTSFEECARVRFMLNGKCMDKTFTMPSRYCDKDTILKTIVDHVVEVIAKEVVVDLLENETSFLKELYSR